MPSSDSEPERMETEEASENDDDAQAGESDSSNNAVLHNDDPDTLRIMISTDNHLGYAERDNIRGMDSFAAFEEVLYLAKHFSCDMVLIAGDLFHDNRPTRRTLHKTMEILRRYCMGQDAVKIEMLSDAATQFRSAISGAVNYQDPNYAIALPIFSIHGNHDDPSRDQGGGELLAALDLLAVSNLVNYFGRQDEVDKVEISPVLLKKGDTKVALYGLGSLRDERLNRMWEKQKVRFRRPEQADPEGEDDFFNIFTLHQNRDLGRGSKNCVQESMIPEWMDIVVWGHEHECLIEFFESVVGTFRITQPGSSVATSLVAGESARKKVGILDIRGKNFRMHPVPLTQVRSFVTTELSLREHRAELDVDDPKIEKKVTDLLEEEVNLLALNAREKRKEVVKDATLAGSNVASREDTTKYKLQNPNEVLVRIRVEHNGFSTLNNQRFGAKFVGEVANPTDMLLFHRKKDPRLASEVKKKNLAPIEPEELERTNMEDLIGEQLHQPDGKLGLLDEAIISESLEEYVDKSMTTAIPEKAKETLKLKQNLLIKAIGSQGDSRESNGVDENSSRRPNTCRGDSTQSNTSVLNGSIDEDVSEIPKPVKKRRTTAAAGSKRRTAELYDFDSDDDNVASKRSGKSQASAPSSARPRRGSTKQKVVYALDESDDDVVSDAIIEDDDDDDDSNHQTEKGGRTRSRGVSKNHARAPKRGEEKRSRNVASSKASSRRSKYESDSDDDIAETNGADLQEDWGTANTQSRSQRW